MEVLKQDQYVPMAVEAQVISFYAVTNGYLDDVPVEKLKEFETELLNTMKLSKSDVMDEIVSKGKIDDELKAKIDEAIKEFKSGFDK